MHTRGDFHGGIFTAVCQCWRASGLLEAFAAKELNRTCN
jgi:hypothetical protein